MLAVEGHQRMIGDLVEDRDRPAPPIHRFQPLEFLAKRSCKRLRGGRALRQHAERLNRVRNGLQASRLVIKDVEPERLEALQRWRRGVEAPREHEIRPEREYRFEVYAGRTRDAR